MAKKPKSDLDQPSSVEQEIVRIVEKTIKDSQIQLAVDDIKIIAHEVMPDIDRLIANKIAQHFCEIGQLLTDKFKLGD